VFVVPNPSGRNAAFPRFQDKVVWFRRLARWAEALVPGATARGRVPTSRLRTSRSGRPARPRGPGRSAPRR
jgi:hypothetical protein